MSRFGIVYEDPMYDEDGVLVDEDADWEDMDEEFDDPADYMSEIERYDPFDTVNS